MRSFRRGSMRATSRSERDWTLLLLKGQRSSSRSISTAISIQALTGLKSGLTPKLHRPGLSRNPLAGRVAQSQAPLLKNPNPVSLRMSEWDGKSGIPGVVYSGHDSPWTPEEEGKIYVLEHASDTRLMPAALSEVAHLSNAIQESAF